MTSSSSLSVPSASAEQQTTTDDVDTINPSSSIDPPRRTAGVTVHDDDDERVMEEAMELEYCPDKQTSNSDIMDGAGSVSTMISSTQFLEVLVHRVVSEVEVLAYVLVKFFPKLILEVFGGAGAIWGFSEACGLRTPDTLYFWRPASLTVGGLFLVRFLWQLYLASIAYRNGQTVKVQQLASPIWDQHVIGCDDGDLERRRQ